MREREKLMRLFFNQNKRYKIVDSPNVKILVSFSSQVTSFIMNRMCVEKENHDKIATLRRGAESLILSSDDHFFMPFLSASAVNLSCITRDIASSF